MSEILYDLVAATVHGGNAAGGHYWAFVRVRKNDEGKPDDPEWKRVSDTSVSNATFEDVQKACCTNLIYVQRLGKSVLHFLLFSRGGRGVFWLQTFPV